MTDLPVRSRFQIGGWHVLAAVVGFFAIVIVVDVGFAIFAYRTFPGEVSSTPYEDGVAYNRKLAQMAAQGRLGWAPVANTGNVYMFTFTTKGTYPYFCRPHAGAGMTGTITVQ